ncbi:MAG: ATP phosphoribosyltransferase regulatory subunit [Pseudomonadota bacterium]
MKRNFAHPAVFQRLLASINAESAEDPTGLGAGLAQLPPDAARGLVRDVLELAGIRAVGGRSVDEITERFIAKADDAAMSALSPTAVMSVRKFLDVRAAPRAALDQLRAAAAPAGADIDAALENASARFDLIEKAGVDLSEAIFSASFGRQFDYYTDFVFELVSPKLGPQAPLAAGGRYDTLLNRLGADRQIPAVGCMLRPDRIAAARGGAT